MKPIHNKKPPWNLLWKVNINKSKIQFETYSQHDYEPILEKLEWISINQRYNLKPIHNIGGAAAAILGSEYQ